MKDTYASRLTNFVILPNGNLKIERVASVEEIKTVIEDTTDPLVDLLDYQLCNGWDWIRPEEIGALTDAPILGQVTRNDDGDFLDGDVYWFPDYMVTDPVEHLLTHGYVIFQKA